MNSYRTQQYQLAWWYKILNTKWLQNNAWSTSSYLALGVPEKVTILLFPCFTVQWESSKRIFLTRRSWYQDDDAGVDRLRWFVRINTDSSSSSAVEKKTLCDLWQNRQIHHHQKQNIYHLYTNLCRSLFLREGTTGFLLTWKCIISIVKMKSIFKMLANSY